MNNENRKELLITFTNHIGSISIPPNMWTDYMLKDGFFMILNGEECEAMYNASEVFSVTAQ